MGPLKLNELDKKSNFYFLVSTLLLPVVQYWTYEIRMEILILFLAKISSQMFLLKLFFAPVKLPFYIYIYIIFMRSALTAVHKPWQCV